MSESIAAPAPAPSPRNAGSGSHSPRRQTAGLGSLAPSSATGSAASSAAPSPTAAALGQLPPPAALAVQTYGPAVAARLAADVSARARSAFPSDSGAPLMRGKLYKVHFRVYATVVYDAVATNNNNNSVNTGNAPSASATNGLHDSASAGGESSAVALGGGYSLHVCRLFKLYHSKAPYEPAGTGFDATVSKYLAHRLGNQVLAPAFVDACFAEFVPIIRDTGTFIGPDENEIFIC